MASSGRRGECPTTVNEARSYFSRLGLDTVPLVGRTKRPLSLSWPSRSPADMWSEVTSDANIGIRGGGHAHAGIFDFDDKAIPGTSQRGIAWLQGLGLRSGDYPLVQSASGVGRHAYVRMSGSLDGNAAQLREHLGAGEFRYGPAAYVVAPPSTVGGAPYELLSGSFEGLPVITVGDILPVLARTPVREGRRITGPVFDLRAVSKRTRDLMRHGGKAQYGSRSQAEQAIIVDLIRAGAGYEDVEQIFREWPCAGRYREEYQRSAEGAGVWLRLSFDRAVAFLERPPTQRTQIAGQAIVRAKARPWHGRTGQTDQVVFIAHAEIAQRVGRLEYGASLREIAISTGLALGTCQKATKRLRQAGFLRLIRTSNDGCSNAYSLESQSRTIPHSGEG